MARFLLDTSVLVDISNGLEPSTTQLERLLDSPNETCICAVVIAEFFAGVPPDERPRWETFLGQLRFLPATFETSLAAGRYRYDFARRGVAFVTPDALIAAVARQWDAMIVTENLKHFPMDDVLVRSFRD